MLLHFVFIYLFMFQSHCGLCISQSIPLADWEPVTSYCFPGREVIVMISA